MQRWQDELTKHPLNTTVKQLVDFLDKEKRLADPTIEAERARFAKVIYLLQDTLSILDPDLTPFDLLDQIQSQLNNHGVLQSVQSLSQGQDLQIYHDVNTRLTPVLSYIAQLRASAIKTGVSKADTKAATEAFERFAGKLSDQRKDYETIIAETYLRIDDMRDRASKLEASTKAASETFSAQISQWSAETTAALAEQKVAFSAALSKNKADLADSVTSIKALSSQELKAFFATQEEDAKNKQDRIGAVLDAIVSDSDEKHKKILTLYGLVAVDSVTGGHKKIADREQTAAQNWRRVTVVSIGVVVAWLLYSLFYMKPELGSERAFWLQIGKSISLTALMISFAVYASKQAALHRVNERKARAFFLQVQAFDPFIESLEPTDRQELKKSLSARIFAPEDIQQDQGILESGAFDAVDRVMGFMERIAKLKAK